MRTSSDSEAKQFVASTSVTVRLGSTPVACQAALESLMVVHIPMHALPARLVEQNMNGAPSNTAEAAPSCRRSSGQVPSPQEWSPSFHRVLACCQLRHHGGLKTSVCGRAVPTRRSGAEQRPNTESRKMKTLLPAILVVLVLGATAQPNNAVTSWTYAAQNVRSPEANQLSAAAQQRSVPSLLRPRGGAVVLCKARVRQHLPRFAASASSLQVVRQLSLNNQLAARLYALVGLAQYKALKVFSPFARTHTHTQTTPTHACKTHAHAHARMHTCTTHTYTHMRACGR